MPIFVYPAVILGLGLLVFVHEFGHYAVAKLCGVRVEAFSLGFGKRIFGFVRGGTDYRVSVLPLGGYVKMAGENPMEARTGDPGEFMSHPRWQRFLIAIAGPAMNLLFAIAVLTGVFMFRNERPVYLDQAAVIGGTLDNSPAQKAGIQIGDKIVRIQDLDNPTWEQVLYKIILNPNQPVDVTLQRGNETLSKTVVPQTGRDHLGDMGWLPETRTLIKKLEPDFPASKAGMQVGDEIVSLNDVPVRSNISTFIALQQNKEKPIAVSFLHKGQRKSVTLTPRLDPIEKRYRVGVLFLEETRVERLAFVPAFSKAAEQSKTDSLLIVELVKKLFERKISVKTLESPIGIVRDSGEAALQEGWTPLLQVMSLISINLAIFNLFPIPILDGGLMLMLLIESLMRRDINQEVKERVYQAAFVFLLLFAAMVIYNDMAKLPGLSRYMP